MARQSQRIREGTHQNARKRRRSISKSQSRTQSQRQRAEGIAHRLAFQGGQIAEEAGAQSGLVGGAPAQRLPRRDQVARHLRHRSSYRFSHPQNFAARRKTRKVMVILLTFSCRLLRGDSSRSFFVRRFDESRHLLLLFTFFFFFFF